MGFFKRKKDGLSYINENSGFTSLGYEGIDPKYDDFVRDHEKIIQDLVTSIDMDWRNKDFFEAITAKFATTHIDILEKHKKINVLTNKNITNKLTTQINIVQAENEMIDLAKSLFEEYYKQTKVVMNNE